MAIRITTAPSGRPYLAWLGLVALAALLAVRLAARPAEVTEAESLARVRPAERGALYEDHVLLGGRLARTVRPFGGTLRLHPRVALPRVEVPARYFAMPGGHAGGVVADTPHRAAPSTWASLGTAAYRIPDALEHRPDGTEVLYELKCPSPWLVIDRGTAWAAGMQAAFASQALAYLVWARAAPSRRRVVYGFCGWVPAWAQAILADLEARFGLWVEVRDTFLATDFPPAARLVGRPARELATAAVIADLAPEVLAGPLFDLRKD